MANNMLHSLLFSGGGSGGGGALPPVTTDDNGKVMTVANGVWEVGNPFIYELIQHIETNGSTVTLYFNQGEVDSLRNKSLSPGSNILAVRVVGNNKALLLASSTAGIFLGLNASGGAPVRLLVSSINGIEYYGDTYMLRSGRYEYSYTDN